MAEINPKKIGDITYTQEPFWRVVTMQVDTVIPVVKGKIMSTNIAGDLVAYLNTGIGGGMQPLADAAVSTAEEINFVQVALQGSRMLLKAATNNIRVGQPVKLTSAHDSVDGSGTRIEATRFGTIVEIYTRNNDGTKKKTTVTPVNPGPPIVPADLVVVDTGIF